MHGQAKVPVEEKERKKKEKKGKRYVEGMQRVFEKRKNQENDLKALELISDVLCKHPDVYTLWNYRKEILLEMLKEKTKEELKNINSEELNLTEVCLRKNPKSYCAWYHRLWLINNFPDPNLKWELSLCNKYLKLDSRNFHCWGYRRDVANKLGISKDEELKYTKIKIEENFSNYSSWHYRSKLLPLLYDDPNGIRPISEKYHVKELEMVLHATFTDPNDSSAWFYLRWLLGRLQPNETITRIFIRNRTIFVAFNQSVDLLNGNISINIPDLGTEAWLCPPDRKTSTFWWTNINDDLLPEFIKIIFKSDTTNEVILGSPEFMWSAKPQFQPDVSPTLLLVLNQQLDSLNELLELEPDSKWALLTSVVLMQAIDKKKYKEDILKRFELLLNFDKLRKNYYLDIRSKFIIEDLLENWEPVKNKTICELNMSHLDLSALYHMQYLACADIIKLSASTFQNLRKGADFEFFKHSKTIVKAATD